MQTIIGFFSDGTKSKVNFLKTWKHSQFSGIALQISNLVESNRQYFESRRQIIQMFDLIVIQKYFFNVVIIRVIQKCKLFKLVMLKGYLSEGLEVVEVDGGEGEVVGEYELAFGGWWDDQPGSF